METQETNYLVPLRVGIGLKNADILTYVPGLNTTHRNTLNSSTIS